MAVAVLVSATLTCPMNVTQFKHQQNEIESADIHNIPISNYAEE